MASSYIGLISPLSKSCGLIEHHFFALICDKKQVYKPLLGCIGEFPTVALGGVLRFAGFLLMSFSATPVELLDS